MAEDNRNRPRPDSEMYVAGIILAAGTSSRTGSANKLLLKFRSRTIIEEVLLQMTKSNVDEIIIVTGHENSRVEAAVSSHLTGKVFIVHNDRYRFGRAESVKCAIRNIRDRSDAALFMVGDKPGVSTSLINKAIERFKQSKPPILYIETPVGRGHPIIFSNAIFIELLDFQGNTVGDSLVEKYRDDLIALKDDQAQIDVDNLTDYEMLLKSENIK